jgi:Uncharacterized alpha/beta hydrolase domain (DUF2235)
VHAREFCETYRSRQEDTSEYPYFIGVFDTVASIASKGALIVLGLVVFAVAAALATVLWLFYPSIGVFAGRGVSAALARAAAFVHFEPSLWWPWLVAVPAAIFVITFVWYVMQQVKFAPQADPKRPWRTLTIWLGRMSFEDKTLNDNVPYARHAISIDENRAAFARVGWGDLHSTRPDKDADGFSTFEQVWFAGNHSDIGGSYVENESRLSDVSLSWMVEAATTVMGGIKIDGTVLRLYPSANGMQHDERKSGFPILTSWLRLTWQGKQRNIDDPHAPLHDSVYQRFALPGVVHYDNMQPYRPEGLRQHEKLADYYKDIPAPSPRTGIVGYLKSFFLTS